jgi:hypothetical protein
VLDEESVRDAERQRADQKMKAEISPPGHEDLPTTRALDDVGSNVASPGPVP